MGRPRKTKEQFIEESHRVHGNKYDYSKVEYQGNQPKVCIICPIHGEFWQKPYDHLRGCGCQECGKAKATKSRSTEQFIQAAKSVYGDYYDYSKVEYKSRSTKVCIIHPLYGEFWQTPNNHLNGHKGKREYLLSKNKSEIGGNYLSPSYKKWRRMIDRCREAKKGEPKRKTYLEVTICEEWLKYENFKEWFENPENGYQEGYQLDKDILVKGNKEYAPDKCCFVPQEINVLCAHKKEGELPCGVSKSGRAFIASITKGKRRVHLGTFETHEEAFNAYKVSKEDYIKQIAEDYFAKGKITKVVYNALMSFEV